MKKFILFFLIQIVLFQNYTNAQYLFSIPNSPNLPDFMTAISTKQLYRITEPHELVFGQKFKGNHRYRIDPQIKVSDNLDNVKIFYRMTLSSQLLRFPNLNNEVIGKEEKFYIQANMVGHWYFLINTTSDKCTFIFYLQTHGDPNTDELKAYKICRL